jgi:hypothetical protein
MAKSVSLKRGYLNARAMVGLITLAALLTSLHCSGSDSGTKPTATASPASDAKNYELPSDAMINAIAERDQEGQIFISGSTNLPDGVKIEVEIPNTSSQDMNVVVGAGHFTSTSFLLKDRPYPDGPHKVHFFAYFNNLWQNEQVRKIIGEGGKKLKGTIFKKEDPDVVDSDLTLDYVVTIPFPAISPETRAIDIVKKAVLGRPDIHGRPVTVEQGVKWLMGPPPPAGVHLAKAGARKLTSAIPTSSRSTSTSMERTNKRSGQLIWYRERFNILTSTRRPSAYGPDEFQMKSSNPLSITQMRRRELPSRFLRLVHDL